MTTERFIDKARQIHGANKYDYSQVEYVNTTTDIIIICSEHGPFIQKPRGHLSGNGCKKCFKRGTSNTGKRDNWVRSQESFLARARQIHGANKYDYSQTKYQGCSIKVIIECPQHGPFEQLPKNHFSGKGCIKCGQNRTKKQAADFFRDAALRHNSKYDYSQSLYVNSQTNITITCPQHGLFEQRAGEHIKGHGCAKCAREAGSIWGATNWAAQQKGRTAALYIVRLSGYGETFYKVGITLNAVNHRLGRGNVPYCVEIIVLYKSTDAVAIHNLESAIKRKFKSLRYKPTQRFAGYTECYRSTEEIQVFVEAQNNNKITPAGL